MPGKKGISNIFMFDKLCGSSGSITTVLLYVKFT